MNSAALLKLHEQYRGYLLNQVVHYNSDFRNEFKKRSSIEKEILTEVDEYSKTLAADMFLFCEFISNCIQAESEENLASALDDWKRSQEAI